MSKQVLQLCALYEPTRQALEANYTCHRLWEADDAGAMLKKLAPSIEVVATYSGHGIDAATLDALPNLKLVSNFGVGLDMFDLEDCRARGVTVCNTPDVLTEEVADMALALVLASVREIVKADRYVRAGEWPKANMNLTRSLQQRKVGIVGMGRIGQAIARRCEAFNNDIAYFGPREKPVDYQYFNDVQALAKWADVLIAACPGGPATYHVVSRKALLALGDDGIFVNIARGSVVDQAALVELLVSGQLGGAGLDVFDDEPNVPAELIALDHVVMQPHQGSASFLTRQAMGQRVLDNIAAWFDGKELLSPAN